MSISIHRKIRKIYVEGAMENYNKHYPDLAMFSLYRSLELYLRCMLIYENSPHTHNLRCGLDVLESYRHVPVFEMKNRPLVQGNSHIFTAQSIVYPFFFEYTIIQTDFIYCYIELNVTFYNFMEFFETVYCNMGCKIIFFQINFID